MYQLISKILGRTDNPEASFSREQSAKVLKQAEGVLMCTIGLRHFYGFYLNHFAKLANYTEKDFMAYVLFSMTRETLPGFTAIATSFINNSGEHFKVEIHTSTENGLRLIVGGHSWGFYFDDGSLSAVDYFDTNSDRPTYGRSLAWHDIDIRTEGGSPLPEVSAHILQTFGEMGIETGEDFTSQHKNELITRFIDPH